MKTWIALLLASLAFALFSQRASAADIDGKWSAHLGGPDGPQIVFTFSTTGARLTGSVNSPMGAVEIQNGQVNGSDFSFGVPFDGGLIQYRCHRTADDVVVADLLGGPADGMSLRLTRGVAPDVPPPLIKRSPHAWWRDRTPGQRPYSKDAGKLPLISVQGNRFVDASGQPVLFRGLAISDPDKLEMQGHWNRDLFVKVQAMGAKLVRIPVHPVAWRERTPTEYLKLLDQAVGWCTDLNLYVMIDWHSIGNLETEVFQDPMYRTSRQETFEFWRVMARHYNGHHTVALFELFNEPTTYRDQLGPVAWADWKRTVESEITLIRAANPQVIPVVAGFDWAYDLTPLRLSPIAAERIAYADHPYANKRPPPWEPKWELDFGFAADKYPVIATEFGGFGWPPAGVAGTAPTEAQKRLAAYGPAIIKYLESRNISWTVWCFDPEWGPSLIKDWQYDLTPSGEFAKAALHGQIK